MAQINTIIHDKIPAIIRVVLLFNIFFLFLISTDFIADSPDQLQISWLCGIDFDFFSYMTDMYHYCGFRVIYPSRSRSAEIAFTISWSSSTTRITEFSVFIYLPPVQILLFTYLLFYLSFAVYVNIINSISYKNTL